VDMPQTLMTLRDENIHQTITIARDLSFITQRQLAL
jgi:hypothetical protein